MRLALALAVELALEIKSERVLLSYLGMIDSNWLSDSWSKILGLLVRAIFAGKDEISVDTGRLPSDLVVAGIALGDDNGPLAESIAPTDKAISSLGIRSFRVDPCGEEHDDLDERDVRE
jgi:hypothetical protein